MSSSDDVLKCWKCGADLKVVPRPFSRFAECPQCKAELHVCRMCRHYDPRYIGACSHEFADKVLEKEKSNFCGHFKPSPDAFEGGETPAKKEAQQELESLFGADAAESTQTETGSSGRDVASEKDAAREKLKDLFDDQ